MRAHSATGTDSAARAHGLQAGDPLAFLFAATAPSMDDESWLLATAGALQSRGHAVTIATFPKTALAGRASEAGFTVLAIRPGRRFNLRARWRAGDIRQRHRFDVAIAFDPKAFEIAPSIASEPTPLVLRASALDTVVARADAASTATELECAVHATRLQRAGFAARHPALFVDRDGTLVENVPYNGDPKAVVLEPHVGRALRWARDAGFALVVVTNQSAVARGLCTAATVEAVNDRIRDLLRAEGCDLDGVYVCPHHPDYGPECDCRKPAPGLLQRAARDLQLDLTLSVLVGDSDRDLEAARRAGVRSLCYRNPAVTTASDAEPVPAAVRVHGEWLTLVSRLLADSSRELA